MKPKNKKYIITHILMSVFMSTLAMHNTHIRAAREQRSQKTHVSTRTNPSSARQPRGGKKIVTIVGDAYPYYYDPFWYEPRWYNYWNYGVYSPSLWSYPAYWWDRLDYYYPDYYWPDHYGNMYYIPDYWGHGHLDYDPDYAHEIDLLEDELEDDIDDSDDIDDNNDDNEED